MYVYIHVHVHDVPVHVYTCVMYAACMHQCKITLEIEHQY